MVCSLRPSLRVISIHVPLAGHDDGGNYLVSDPALISIHMPLAGHDKYAMAGAANDFAFQSTCPLRGTTGRITMLVDDNVFQSTCPLRGTTFARPVDLTVQNFNPRAPCGARQDVTCFDLVCSHFNPRAPCGARLCPPSLRLLKAQFQSTCPLRGTTIRRVEGGVQLGISIHVPLAGHDCCGCGQGIGQPNFNPRAPCGARQTLCDECARHLNFNPRAPCGARL